MLNKGQYDSVFSSNKETLILAGAGTGKTRVIIQRIEELIKNGAEPSKIIATTFTNKAAKELRTRLFNSIGEKAYEIICGTFHKISAQFLRKHYQEIGLEQNFQVLNEDDQKQLMKRFLKQADSDKKPKIMLDHISQLKETGKLADKNNNSLFKLIFQQYESELSANNYLDYSDLIQKAILLFKTHPNIANELGTDLLVDEYQDINYAQYNWIKLLGENKRLFCVGDEDQAIYSFRGASIEYIQQFKKDYPNAKIVKLEENYRSAKEILDAATKLISHNQREHAKILIPGTQKEGFIRINKAFNEYEEANLIAQLAAQWKAKNPEFNIAILVRTNMQIHMIEHALVECKIPYTIASGKKLYLRKEVQDIIAYLRILLFPHDFLAFSRIINTPRRYIGKTRLDMILNTMKELECNFEQTLETMLNTLPKNANEKCKIFLIQLQNWRALYKNGMKLDQLYERILSDIEYRKQDDFTPQQEQALENIKLQLAQATSLESFLENLQFEDSSQESQGLIIMTMHASKGLEFDIVIAPGWEEDIFPSLLAKDMKEIQEERRLAYVTITRAKQYLEIIHTRNRRINGQQKKQIPSRFLFELQ
jgi:DNA helicase-2/ATP-dependent DNA helicase PcrA